MINTPSLCYQFIFRSSSLKITAVTLKLLLLADVFSEVSPNVNVTVTEPSSNNVVVIGWRYRFSALRLSEERTLKSTKYLPSTNRPISDHDY